MAILGVIIIIVAFPSILLHLFHIFNPTKIHDEGTTVKMYNHLTQQIQEIPMEEYLVGVVAAEMPASFPTEALKAQAVAARTYVMQRMVPGGISNNKHPGADVSSDPREGQAWISREEMKKRWGAVKSLEYYYKIKWAVESTEGQYITYNSQLIFPAFHSSCGGGTENAEEVWVAATPYLKGVHCPYCADPEPVRETVYSIKEVEQKLKTNLTAMPVTAGTKTKPLAILKETGTGRPKEIRVGNKTYSATVLREMLGLRSTRIAWEIKEDKIIFITRGYGHGVGMCQYGAKGMAEQGKSHEEILKHYYNGIEISGKK